MTFAADTRALRALVRHVRARRGQVNCKGGAACIALLSANCHDARDGPGRRLRRVWMHSVRPAGAQDDRRVAGTTKPRKPRCPSSRGIRGFDGRNTREQATSRGPRSRMVWRNINTVIDGKLYLCT